MNLQNLILVALLVLAVVQAWPQLKTLLQSWGILASPANPDGALEAWKSLDAYLAAKGMPAADREAKLGPLRQLIVGVSPNAEAQKTV